MMEVYNKAKPVFGKKKKNLSNKKPLIYGCYHHCSRPSR